MSIITSNEVGLPKPNYKYITNEEDAREAMDFLDRYSVIAVDTETTSLDPYEAKWSLLQIGVPDHSFVFDVRHDTEFSSLHPKVLDPILTDPNKLRLLQNASYDMKIIKLSRGYYLPNVYDTMLNEQLMNLGLFVRASLEALVKRYLGLTMTKEPRNTFTIYEQKFEPFQIEYAANDVVPLHHIRECQLPVIGKENLSNASRLESEFLIPLCEMELNGILIDTEKWRIIMQEVERERVEIRKVIHNILSEVEDQTTLFGGSTINIDSNVQLKKALNKYGLSLEKTDVGTLEKHKGLPVIDAILDYRKANKLISTYAESLLEKISKYTGRLHTDFRQMVSTGRMSSSNPNLQNIPGKQKYRSCFIAKEGYDLLTADMSGAELRILGNLSQDPVFVESYATGQDLHTRTAAEIFDVPYDKVEKMMRKAAKAINFGLCLPENTNIITAVGIKRIIETELGDVVTHDIGTDEVIDKAFMGEKEVFELKTKYGYSLEVTKDHLVKVVNSDGHYVDKRLCDLNKETDLVCLKKGSGLFNDTNFKFPKHFVEKHTNYKSLPVPEEVDVLFASFLGLFVSEGSVFKVKKRDRYSVVSFGFSRENKELIEKINVLFFNLFGDRVSTPKGKYARYVINSVELAEWLSIICGLTNNNKTDTITLPECIKLSPKDKQAAFLRWLFEGDGTVKNNGSGYKISYSSNSYGLVKDLQLMLLNFGVLSSITEEYRKGSNKTYYILSLISSECQDVFLREVGFVTDYKMSKCVSATIYDTSSYFVGSHEDKIRRIMKDEDVSQQLKDRFYLSRYGDNIGSIYLRELSMYDNFFKFMYENGIVPLPIKSIKSKGIKRVCDLSIENHQYFLANGFVVHNCYGMSSKGLANRLKISDKEAEIMINKYFNRYKGVKRYLDKAGKDAVMNRYSLTISGRRRYYNMPPYDHPDRKSIQRGIERQGKNAGIQGSNADTIKEAMILLVERLKPYDAKLVLTVHDEVVVEAVKEQSHEVGKVVAQSLVDGFGRYFSLIPMETDTLSGPCWLKDACENETAPKTKCGGTEMKFVPDKKKGSRLVCAKCGAGQE